MLDVVAEVCVASQSLAVPEENAFSARNTVTAKWIVDQMMPVMSQPHVHVSWLFHFLGLIAYVVYNFLDT